MELGACFSIMPNGIGVHPRFCCRCRTFDGGIAKDSETCGADFRLPSLEIFAALAALDGGERFRKGQVILLKERPRLNCSQLRKGSVVTREDGKEVILDIIANHDWFGEETLI